MTHVFKRTGTSHLKYHRKNACKRYPRIKIIRHITILRLVGYFRLSIFATGWLFEGHPQKTVSCYRVIVQEYRTKLPRAPPGS